MKKLAVILLIILAAGTFFAYAIVSREIRANIAQSRGDAFIAKLYADYATQGKSCQGEDTDGDGYVSCDFRITNASGQERIVHLQCPTIWKTLLGGSCKEARAVISTQ